MRTEQETEQLLDNLVMQSGTEATFRAMSAEQRTIAAVQLLVSTTTRSGITEFFDPVNAYLWPYAHQGLKLLGATRCHQLLGRALEGVQAGKPSKTALDELGNGIVIKDFEFLYGAIRQYLNDHFNNIKP